MFRIIHRCARRTPRQTSRPYPVRILFTAHQFFPESRAGVEIVTLGLARELKACGHEPFILAARRTVPHSNLLPGETEDYEFEGVPVRRIGRPEEGLSRPYELNYHNEEAAGKTEEYVRAVVANMPRVFFLLLPLCALLIKLFYWRRDRFYVDHLIFAFHFHAFAFVILTLNSIAARLWDPLSGPLRILLWGWFLTYPALALRRVYGGSWTLTVVKLFGLTVIYFILFGFGMLTLLPVTLYFF